MRPQGKWNLGESSAIAFATGQYVFVMAGRDPAIHAVQMPQISPARAPNNRWTPRSGCVPSRMDGRDKHGHDGVVERPRHVVAATLALQGVNWPRMHVLRDSGTGEV